MLLQMTHPPPPLSSVAPDVPDALAALVDKLLSKAPDPDGPLARGAAVRSYNFV